MEQNDEKSSVPIPKPRRHNINTDTNLNNKTSYENVSIDLINKNINIKDENLQNNAKNKLQTNKLFLIPTTSANLNNNNNDATNPQILTNLNDLANASSNKNQKNISAHLDEVNKLSNIYNDDENANVKPVPAPRRSSSTIKVDNVLLNKISCSPSTGAINKQRDTFLDDFIDDAPKSKSKAGKSSGSYSFGQDDTDASESHGSKFVLRKTHSNSSLSSTQSSSTADGSPSKYHSASPGQLLKVLGTTSKLLTESITERMTNRTKDARQKIDRIHKTSRDRIAETTKSATNKLKSVRKNLHDTIEMTQNLSLGRKKTNSMTKPDNKSNKSASYHSDRPQTVPINDELFSSISFHSPLNSKTNKCMNINIAESSYEIPKSLRSLSSDSSTFSDQIPSTVPPPTYDEVIKEKNSECDQRPNPTARTRRRSKIEVNDYENHEICVPSKNDLKSNSSDSSEDEGDYSMPCPNFPAPVLSEGVYGKIRSTDSEASTSVQPPVRAKRRKDYEQIELKKGNDVINSNRATAGSTEFQTDEKYSKLIGADFSEELCKELKLIEEKNIPKADRSESWSYYDMNSSDRSDEISSPEPIYENDVRHVDGTSEPLYGVIYDAESPKETMLTPVAVARKRRSQERSSGGYAKVNKSPDVKLRTGAITTDVLKEFDPLDRKTLDKILASKSNELILLESILSSETYGNCAEESNYDYNSTGTSDNEDSEGLPTPPERLDSLKEINEEPEEVCTRRDSNEDNNLSDENRKTVIVHQNTTLRSDSSDNIVDDVSNESSGSNVVEEKASNSRWFLTSSLKSEKKSKSDKKKGKDEKTPADTADDEKPMTPLTKTSSMKSMFSNVMNKVEGIKRKTSFRSNANKNEVKIVLEMIPRPCLTQRLILHEGHLIRLPTGMVEDILKELHSRKAYIRDKKFQAYFDKDMRTPKENIPLEWITTIQCVYNHKFSNNSFDFHCFEITTAIPKNVGLSNPNMVITSNNSGNTKTQRLCHLYGVAKESERFIWMQKLLESLTDVFPPGFSCRFYRAGWCYSKNSITSTWSGTWLLLQKEKRRLLFFNYLNMNLECMDLRKARCLVLKESDDSIKNLHVESGPTLMIDCPPYTMYFIMTSPRETKIWRHIIQEVAHNNGPSLKEQQLTKDNVPVLVDKCINFIYTHGSMSEGIYRKSGSENSIQKLLKKFRSDAYSTQIIRSEYNEHDVANVLKRFMRDLPDRLLGRYTSSLISVSQMKEIREKVEAYKELLTRLPSIEYHTLRKLLGHLHFIQSQKSQNKMDFANLAIVWGPTLLHDQQIDANQQYSQKSADVVIELIKFYKNLYALSPEEITKEQLMLAVLQKYHAAAENLTDSMKKSGDLKVWITIDGNPDDDKEEKQQINVTLTPTKTVNDICKELAPKINRESFNVTLSEIILNDSLQRPLHHNEKVFDIVLKWSYWPEADRKNNYLRLTPIKLMKEVERALKVLPSVTPNKELKFADCKTKSLKSYTLELTDHHITVMKKEKSTIVKIREIDLMRATAYLGCEKKRDFQLRWAITLIEDDTTNKTNVKARETPFIGHVIAGTNSNDQIVWYTSILHSLYADNIFPTPEIILQ